MKLFVILFWLNLENVGDQYDNFNLLLSFKMNALEGRFNIYLIKVEVIWVAIPFKIDIKPSNFKTSFQRTCSKPEMWTIKFFRSQIC